MNHKMRLVDYPTTELQHLLTAIEEQCKKDADTALQLHPWFERVSAALNEHYNGIMDEGEAGGEIEAYMRSNPDEFFGPPY